MPTYHPTIEQQKAIELANDNSVQTLKILAFAGAGKTSTLQLIAESMPNKKGIYLAFNKAIVEDVKRKMPANVEVRTFHSLAYAAMPRYIIDKIKNGSKFTEKTYVSDLLNRYQIHSNFVVTGEKILTDEQKIIRENLGKPTQEIVTIILDSAKQFKIIKYSMDSFLTNMDSEPSYEMLSKIIPNALGVSLEVDYIKPIADMLHPVLTGLWHDYKSENGKFQIPHDVYLKLYALSQPQINKNFILFDEAQDADSLMLHVIKAQNIKVILVGDTYQQLYEWRGAINAMQQIQQGETCYLTQSFRFGAVIANNANKLLNMLGNDKPLIGASPVNGDIAIYGTFPKDINAIVCRTNVGVVNSALDYASQYPNKKIYIDITGGQGEMIDTLKAIEDLSRFSDDKPTTGAYKTHPIIQYFDTFRQLEDYVQSFPSDLAIAPIFNLWCSHGVEKVERIISDFASEQRKNNHDVRIQTVHKAKGLEWDSVAFCDDFEGYYFKVESENDKAIYNFKSDSAVRAVYVAQTRAKKQLYLFDNEINRNAINQLSKVSIIEPMSTQAEPVNIEVNDTNEPDHDYINQEENEARAAFFEQTNIIYPDSISVDGIRHYTARSEEGEQRRKEAALIGIKRATEAGTIGRPKARAGKELDKIKRLIESGDWTLKEIAEFTKLSLSTIKRLKSEMRQ